MKQVQTHYDFYNRMQSSRGLDSVIRIMQKLNLLSIYLIGSTRDDFLYRWRKDV